MQLPHPTASPGFLVRRQSGKREQTATVHIKMKIVRLFAFAVLALLLQWQRQAAAYSLLTHEQLIDLTRQDSIVPLLLSQYPSLTQADLDRARAYAYGDTIGHSEATNLAERTCPGFRIILSARSFPDRTAQETT